MNCCDQPIRRLPLKNLSNQSGALDVGGRRNVVGVVTQGLPLFSGTDFPKTGVRI